ncbi:hypothetical protein BDV93DRAFT_519697 [Ceratobasidium sp. AG-I]|nr:hypothetical protein BDV93DRAFT_519697 [Ceratobasidium sp. AG-I]
MPDRAPAYVSARSADEILSTIRPTKIKTESLRSLNIFLDELLWLILHAARSLATNRLKAGLLQIMPSSVGKDAILEAEVELRGYKQRTPGGNGDEYGTKQTDFPLQPTFELLRQKCEAYCTLGELDENVVVEAALQEKMVSAGLGAPKAEQVAPAALYLTAILEHVCEHVLNNVGQVVARDSSRGTAHSQDVYVALCEDAAVYPLFKTMKVHDQIEAQSRAFKPSHGGSSSISGGSRTRSISRIRPSEDPQPGRKMSLPTPAPNSPVPGLPSNNAVPPSSFTRRPSADAVMGGGQHSVTRSISGPTLSGSSKSSLERTRSSLERITGKKSMDGTGRTADKSSRSMKLFGKGSTRTSLEDGPGSHMAPFPSVAAKEAVSGPDERSASSLSDTPRRPTPAFRQPSLAESDVGDDSDGPFNQDFDELMRSGATMKVSLTPDRLKTFEVFAKQKNQRTTRGQPHDSASSSAPPPLPTSTSLPFEPSAMTLSPRVPVARREVESILEADEGHTRSRSHSVAQFLNEEPKVPAAPVPAPSSVGRSRSHTESSSSRPSISTKPSNGTSLLRKASFGRASRDRERSSPDNTTSDESNRTRKVSEAPNLPTMSGMPKRTRGVARRRESMDLDDIMNEPVLHRRGADSGGASPALMPKPAHQMANTRDLIDFLSEGPPEPPQVPRSVSSSAIEPGLAAKPKQGGRWFRRLVGGSSFERTPAVPDVPEPTRTLGKQKSVQNIRGAGFSGFSQSSNKIPPSPALSLDTALQPQALDLTRKVSPNRKAVPAWSPDDSVPTSAPQSPPISRSPEPVQAKEQSKLLLSPQRAEFDVYGASRPRQGDPAPSASPLSSKSASLRRVPVPRLHPDPVIHNPSHTDTTEYGLQIAPEPVAKAPEPRPERRRPEKTGSRPSTAARTTANEDAPTELSRVASPSAPLGGMTASQAAELRAAFAHATTADECRVLLDLVLGQWGLGRHVPEPSAVPPLSAADSDFDYGDEAMAVDMLLGEGSMRSDRQWPLTPKDSQAKLHDARVASVRSSE